MGDSVYVVSIAELPAAALLQRDKLKRPDPAAPEYPSPNAWLFQSNPVLYDLRAALRSLEEQVWSVSRYASQIREGDRVYLWEAGRCGGIVGIGQIVEPPRLQPEPPEQQPFARDDELFARERIRAKLRIVRIIVPVIARQTIVSCPPLRMLDVLRCSRGTNFRLSPEQRSSLDALILGLATT